MNKFLISFAKIEMKIIGNTKKLMKLNNKRINKKIERKNIIIYINY